MIKKVVIPQTEVRYVCELSEEEAKRHHMSVAGSAFIYEVGSNPIQFLRKETPKPLADDEVSVKSFDIKNIYAIKGNNGNIYTYCAYNKRFININGCSYCLKDEKFVSFADCFNTFITGKYQNDKYTIYEFSGSNKQQEFFEWALKQLGSN